VLLRLDPRVLATVGRRGAARLHPMLGDPDTIHIVRIEPPANETRRQSELPL